MNLNRMDELWPEILAAYADGELDPETAQAVRRRLSVDPAAQRALEAQAAFSPSHRVAWRVVEPQLPEPAQWSAVWREIERGVSSGPVIRRAPHRAKWFRRGLMGVLLAVPATVVAAVVMAVCVPQLVPPVNEQGPAPGHAVVEMFAVADPTDVNLLSVRDADLPQFVVGVPPVSSDLPLISNRNVRLQEIPNEWDLNLDSSKPEDDHAPLILMPSLRSR